MNIDAKDRKLIELLAEQQGLARALSMFPEAVHAAAERGLKPLGAPPAGCTPLTAPAPIFDPSRFEPTENRSK